MFGYFYQDINDEIYHIQTNVRGRYWYHKAIFMKMVILAYTGMPVFAG